jgi:hypothetical protein
MSPCNQHDLCLPASSCNSRCELVVFTLNGILTNYTAVRNMLRVNCILLRYYVFLSLIKTKVNNETVNYILVFYCKNNLYVISSLNKCLCSRLHG